MDLLLRQEADRARDIANVLSGVRNYVKEHLQDLTLAIAELNQLSCAVDDLDDQIHAAGGRLDGLFVEDLRLLQDSVAFTLKDVWTILGKIPQPALKVDYSTAWRNVVRYCQGMGNQSLTMRLKTYKLFACGLCKVLRR